MGDARCTTARDEALSRQETPTHGSAALVWDHRHSKDVDGLSLGQTLSPWQAEDHRRGTHRWDSSSGRGGSSGSRLGAAERGHVAEDLAAGDGRAVGAGVPLRQLGGEGRQDVPEHRAVAGCTHAQTPSDPGFGLQQAEPSAVTSTCTWAGTLQRNLAMKEYLKIPSCCWLHAGLQVQLSCSRCAFERSPLQHAVPEATHVHKARCCVWSWG